ncbi:MAG: DUF2793 domain-containing protein [Maricaulis sp.]|jgi:hypothetical protein|nr:DUF2793 domain-containing protein [Maricaulis sp.]
MTTSANLGLTYLSASQSQKHVTVNDALRLLDGLIQGDAASRSTSAEPGSPVDGVLYIMPAGKTGTEWGSETDLHLAYYRDGSWQFITPGNGWRFFVADESDFVVWTGSAWELESELFETFKAFKLTSANGAALELKVVEEELTGLSGAYVDSSIQIPNGAIVFNVSERVTLAITGASSFSVGTASQVSKFGSGLWSGLNGVNLGVIGPTAFYADTPIRLTASGGNFTDGSVRIAICYYMPTVPQS